MSLLSQHELASSLEFRNKLKMALCKVALGVAQDLEAVDRESKLFFAREFLRNPEDWTQRVSFFVAAVPGIDSSSSDAAIVAVVTQLWSALGTPSTPPVSNG
jgi:hypothetical protein